MGLIRGCLYHDEEPALIAALEREAEARAAMRAADLAFKASRDKLGREVIATTLLPTIEPAEPDDRQLQTYEQDIAACTRTEPESATPPVDAAPQTDRNS